MQNVEFNAGAIKPIECVQEAWELIKPDYWMLFAISLVGALIAGISLYVLIGAMVCGIFYCYLKRIDGGRVQFEDLWIGFKFFWPSLLVAAAIFVPMVVWIVFMFVSLYLPLIMAAVMGQKGNEPLVLGSFVAALAVDLVIALVMICIHTLLMFSFPLIVDRGMTSWEAMKLSARAVLKNLGGVGGLIAVNFGLFLIGYAACGIGLYFVIPVMTASNIVAYRKVFPSLTVRHFDPPPPTAYSGLQ